MGARKALLFEDPLSFSEFVKRVAPKKSRSKRYELFHISHPEKPGRPALVLLGYNPPRLSHAPILGRSIKAQSLGDQIKLTLAHKQTHTARVLGSDSAEQLTHLVALIQLPESGLTADQAITFWLRDESLGGQLMRDSIRLGNDRIQFADSSRATPSSASTARPSSWSSATSTTTPISCGCSGRSTSIYSSAGDSVTR